MLFIKQAHTSKEKINQICQESGVMRQAPCLVLFQGILLIINKRCWTVCDEIMKYFNWEQNCFSFLCSDYSQSTLNRFLNGNGEFSLTNNTGSLSQNHRSHTNPPSADFAFQSSKVWLFVKAERFLLKTRFIFSSSINLWLILMHIENTMISWKNT